MAFVGGADVSAALHTGHLETLLTVGHRDLGLRFRNLGWEGDTASVQSRDVGFPPLATQLRRAGASVVLVQLGRAEALDGRTSLARFVRDYGRLLDTCATQTPRLVVVTPPPFERGGGLLPDLSRRNGDLAAYVAALRRLARRRGLPLIDLFSALAGGRYPSWRLTSDGLQLTPRGQALAALAFVRQLGLRDLAQAAGEPDETGAWPAPAFERVRQAVIEKNRLWFHSWRPQNWAFLGGDRIDQPSSHDHRDPKVRWFPVEMEGFVPLLARAEARVQSLAREVPGA